MSAITLQITRRLALDPVPFIIMIVFSTNIGSSATVVGNPIGVMIALRGGLTFFDFLRWATPIAVAGLLLAIPLSFWYFARDIALFDHALRDKAGQVIPIEAMPARDLLVSSVLFLGTIGGLVLHHQLESLLGLEKNTMLIGVAAFFAGIALLLDRDRARELVEKRVDWWTLTFFMLLFASAGTLRYVGVTRRIAEGFVAVTGGREGLLLAATTWGSGLLSAFMDNVLAVATLIPVVTDLQEMGAAVDTLWWGLLFGGTFLGNLTLIGSTANIVALGILERDEGIHISFLRWLKPGLVIAVPTLLLAHLLIALQAPLMR
jgi:Na+/H+ antiporter NhaD/arsenite permease-like protein